MTRFHNDVSTILYLAVIFGAAVALWEMVVWIMG